MSFHQQLVTACLQGNEQAFADLVNRFRYPVFGLCLGYVGDFDVAEDMTQETFVLAYLKLHTLADAQFLGPWLKRIAINRCRSHWRQAQRSQPLAEDETLVLADSSPSVEACLVAKERRQEVLNALDRLPDAPRQVLVLFYVQEMTLRDIAAFLGIRESSAKQRLYRARLLLKEEMLEMVQETVGGYELPPDFTEQVVQDALAQGQQKLEARDWQGAQEAFRKVVDVLPEHLEANRGLGLALGREVDGYQRDILFDDDTLAQEAFKTLHKAYELGANDDGVVRRLARLYSNFGRNREGGQFLEQVAESRSNWREKIQWLRVAQSVYYHSHYRNGEDNKAECVRCHRKIRSLIPDTLDVRTQLAAWVPGGHVLAYAHVGLAQEVFDEMDTFERALEADCSVWDYYNIANARGLVYRELEKWEDEVAVGRTFLDWLARVPKGDPRLSTPEKTLLVADERFVNTRVGEWVRWYMMCFMLDKMAQAEYALGQDTTAIFAQMDDALQAHESYVNEVAKTGDEDAIGMAQRKLGEGYTRAGEGAYLAAQFEKALDYYAREEELLGHLGTHGPLYRVGALAGLGRVDDAMDQLGALTGRLISTGQWRTMFEQHRTFDVLRNDDRVIAIMDRWKKAEALGTR